MISSLVANAYSFSICFTLPSRDFTSDSEFCLTGMMPGCLISGACAHRVGHGPNGYSAAPSCRFAFGRNVRKGTAEI